MLYKYPGKHYLERDYYDYIIVPIPDTDKYLAKGWARTPAEAFAAHQSRQQPSEKKGDYIKPKDLDADMKISIAADGRTYKEICEAYNVSYNTVFRVKTGKL